MILYLIQGSQWPGEPGRPEKLLEFYLRPGIFGMINRFWCVFVLRCAWQINFSLSVRIIANQICLIFACNYDRKHLENSKIGLEHFWKTPAILSSKRVSFHIARFSVYGLYTNKRVPCSRALGIFFNFCEMFNWCALPEIRCWLRHWIRWLRLSSLQGSPPNTTVSKNSYRHDPEIWGLTLILKSHFIGMLNAYECWKFCKKIWKCLSKISWNFLKNFWVTTTSQLQENLRQYALTVSMCGPNFVRIGRKTLIFWLKKTTFGWAPMEQIHITSAQLNEERIIIIIMMMMTFI